MNVTLRPFNLEIKLDKKHNRDDFFEYLKKNHFSYNIVRKERLLFVSDINDDYIAGFMLSKRDFSSHCRFSYDAYGKMKLTLAELTEGVEYNFFVLNKHSCNGVYLTYSTAATLKTLEKVLKKCMEDWFLSKGVECNNVLWRKNNIMCNLILSENDL